MNRHIKWVMVVSGLLTITMVYALIAPQAVLQSMFAVSLEGPATDVVVRNWGALIALVGGMLIYGAFVPKVRSFALTIAIISKCTFVYLVLTYARPLSTQLQVSLVADAIFVLIFVIYLLAQRRLT